MRTAGGRYPPHPHRASRGGSDRHGRRFPAPLCRGEDQRRADRRHTPRAGGPDASARLAARRARAVAPRPLFHRDQMSRGDESARPAHHAQGADRSRLPEHLFHPHGGVPPAARLRGGSGRGLRSGYGGDPDVGNRQSGTVRARRLSVLSRGRGAAIRRPSCLSGEGFEDAGGAYRTASGCNGAHDREGRRQTCGARQGARRDSQQIVLPTDKHFIHRRFGNGFSSKTRKRC